MVLAVRRLSMRWNATMLEHLTVAAPQNQREVTGSNPVRGAMFNAPIAQRLERLVEAQEAAGSKPARCTTSCWPVAQLAEHSAVTGDAAGSSPAWPATFRLAGPVAQLS